MNYKYATQARETGDVIDLFDTREDAEKEIENYELDDKNDNYYTPDFYEVRELSWEYFAVNDPANPQDSYKAAKKYDTPEGATIGASVWKRIYATYDNGGSFFFEDIVENVLDRMRNEEDEE